MTSSARSMPHSLDSTRGRVVAGEAHERPAMGEVDEADEVVAPMRALARSINAPADPAGPRSSHSPTPNRSPGHRRRHDRRGRTRRRLRRRTHQPSRHGRAPCQRRLVRQCQCTRGPSLRDLPAVDDCWLTAPSARSGAAIATRRTHCRQTRSGLIVDPRHPFIRPAPTGGQAHGVRIVGIPVAVTATASKQVRRSVAAAKHQRAQNGRMARPRPALWGDAPTSICTRIRGRPQGGSARPCPSIWMPPAPSITPQQDAPEVLRHVRSGEEGLRSWRDCDGADLSPIGPSEARCRPGLGTRTSRARARRALPRRCGPASASLIVRWPRRRRRPGRPWRHGPHRYRLC